MWCNSCVVDGTLMVSLGNDYDAYVLDSGVCLTSFSHIHIA